MVVYLALMLFPLIFSFFKTTDIFKRIILYIDLCLLFLVSAFRYYVGTDYINYVFRYNVIMSNPNASWLGLERGFILLNQFIQYLGGSVQWVFIISSALMIISIGFVSFKYVSKSNWLYFLFLFVSMGYFFASMNILRQYMAIAITLFALPSLLKGKYIPYFISVIFAAFFHKSILILLGFELLVWIFRKRQPHDLLLAFLIATLAGVFIDFRPVAEMVISHFSLGYGKFYLNSIFFQNRNMLAALKLFVPNFTMFLLLYDWKRKQCISFDRKVILLGCWIATCIQNLFYGINVFIRFGDFFFFFSIMGVIFAIRIQKKSSDRLIIAIGYTAYYIILTVVTIFIMGGQGAMPYQSVFSQLTN